MQQLEKAKVERQQDQIKSNARALFTQGGVNAPDHLLKILGENLRLDENGSVVILSGGVQVPLDTHVQSLKQPGSGYEMFFSGTQARGMSAVGSIQHTGGKSWSAMNLLSRSQAMISRRQPTAGWITSTNNGLRLGANPGTTPNANTFT